MTAPTAPVPAPVNECRSLLAMASAGELGSLGAHRAFGRYEQAAYDFLLERALIDEDGGITQSGRQYYAIIGGGK